MPDDSRPRRHDDCDRNCSHRNLSSRRAHQLRETIRETCGYRTASPQSMGQPHPDANRAEGPSPEDPMDFEHDKQPEQQTSENASHRQRQDSLSPTTDYESNDNHARLEDLSGQTGETSNPREETMSKPSGEEKSSSRGGFLSILGVSGLSEQNKQLARVRDDLKTKNKKLSRELDKQDKEIRELKALDSDRMTTITRKNNEIDSMKLKLGQMAQEQQGMEDQIRTAQLAMSKISSRPKVGLVDEERTIKGNFMNLHDEIRKWAKSWGGANFDVIESFTSKKEELAKFVALDNGQIPPTLKTEEMSIRSSVLCVSALLGHFICAEVLVAPFRPLRPLVTTQRAQTNDQDENFQQDNANTLQTGDTILQNIYEKLSNLNEGRAQIWRSDMMSILDPAPIDDASQAEDAANRRTQAACDLTRDFLNANVAVLLPQVETEDVDRRDKQLQSIFQKALDTAGRLWKQLTIVKCVYLEDLKHESFTHESELIEAHAFHKLGLDDEDENRLDNHPIRIVVFPAVKGYGNSDGENYSQDRIWGKAIVWLD